MKRLTWGEFKKVVEQQAKDAGITDLDDRPLGYIDTGGYVTAEDILLSETEDYQPDAQGRKSVNIAG